MENNYEIPPAIKQLESEIAELIYDLCVVSEYAAETAAEAIVKLLGERLV